MMLLIILNIALLAIMVLLIVKVRKSIIAHHQNMELLQGMLRDVIAINKSQSVEAGLSEELDSKLRRVKTTLLNDMEELIREFLNATTEKTG